MLKHNLLIYFFSIEVQLFLGNKVVEVKPEWLYSFAMDIKTLRWQKTRRLVASAGGISRFAERIERTQQQANRFAGPNPVTGIGNKIARLIESSFELEHGFLDKPDSEQPDISEPAKTGVDAIRKADMAASQFVEARKLWLKARPQMLYMVRSELRELLIEHGVDITKESDESFIVSSLGESLRIDLFIPVTGFDVYRYKGTEDMSLPDVLAIPSCQSGDRLGFFLIPKSILTSLEGSDAIRLDGVNDSMNGLPVSDYLNNLSCLM